MADPKVKIALVGGGTIAPLHAKYLLASPTCDLVALIDPFAPGKELASSLIIPHFESTSALLASSTPTPDAYIICVPSSIHVKVATEVITLASPKAILIEKPISTDAQSATELLNLANDKSCRILVGHHRRSHPSLSAAKEAITSGKLGAITSVSCIWAAKKNQGYFDFAAWRSSRSAGGGPVWTNLIHDIDMLHYLTGSRITRVWAVPCPRHRTGTQTLKDIPASELVEEGAVVLAQFANGIVGTFTVNDNSSSPFNWEAAVGDNPSYPKAKPQVDCYRIFGTEGTITGPDGGVWSYLPGEAEKLGLETGWNTEISRKVLEVREGIPFQIQTEHFANVVKGVQEPVCSGEDGIAAVKVCEAIMKALDLGDGLPITIE